LWWRGLGLRLDGRRRRRGRLARIKIGDQFRAWQWFGLHGLVVSEQAQGLFAETYNRLKATPHQHANSAGVYLVSSER
jgi:hypothetical protein